MSTLAHLAWTHVTMESLMTLKSNGSWSMSIYGEDLTIHIYPEDFERSPTRLDEFNQYLEVLQSGSWDK